MNLQVPAHCKLNGVAEEPEFVACDFGFADLRGKSSEFSFRLQSGEYLAFERSPRVSG